MKPAILYSHNALTKILSQINYLGLLASFCCGLLGPLGFAPFHIPGLSILSIAFFYSLIENTSKKRSFYLGFFYGLGYFGLGVSWIIVSIHDYGNLNYPISALLTLLFLAYLALFPALLAYAYSCFKVPNRLLLSMMLFSVLWCLSEFIRASVFSGFPWLLVGTTQIDTPLNYLFPVLGIYGVGLLCVFSSTLLRQAVRVDTKKRPIYVVSLVLILLTPYLLKNIHWTSVKQKPVSVGVIQANLAMRDKWDENLFWQLLSYYEKQIHHLLGKDLIILPESAIPLPASYIEEYLLKLHHQALRSHSALMLGILQATDENEDYFYNAIKALGTASGERFKYQLVPFSEYTHRYSQKLAKR